MPKGTPLYMRMAQKDMELERDALEEKKKRLEEIRAFYQPMDSRDIREHALKYDFNRLVKDEEILEKRRA